MKLNQTKPNQIKSNQIINIVIELLSLLLLLYSVRFYLPCLLVKLIGRIRASTCVLYTLTQCTV